MSIPNSTIKIDGRHDGVDWAIPRKNGVLPIHKVRHNKMTTTPPPGFVASSRGLLQEENGLPRMCTSDGFDPNAYKLTKKSDYDLRQPPPLGNVIAVRPYGLNDTQKVIQR